MKQAILLAAFIAVLCPAFARNDSSKKIHNNIEIACKDSNSIHIPQMLDMLSEIMTVTGLPDKFELREAKVLNIEAIISHHKKYISYNPLFMDWINLATNDKWAAYALLAHEIGHHVDGHTRHKRGSTPRVELEADEFAGSVLYKLGATLNQAQEVMYYIARPESSATHPGRSSRLEAIAKGWKLAQSTVNSVQSAGQESIVAQPHSWF